MHLTRSGLGVNCTEPRLVEPLLCIARRVAPHKLIVAKPNSGEVFDMRGDSVAGRAGDKWQTGWKMAEDGQLATPQEFARMAQRWHEQCGAAFIGGCCRTGHEEIAAIRKVMYLRQQPCLGGRSSMGGQDAGSAVAKCARGAESAENDQKARTRGQKRTNGISGRESGGGEVQQRGRGEEPRQRRKR